MPQLLAGMRDPADRARHGKQHQFMAGRQTERMHQHRQRIVDIDEFAGRFRDALRNFPGELARPRRRAPALPAARARGDRRACRRHDRSPRNVSPSATRSRMTGATSPCASVFTSCAASTPAPPCLRAFQRDEAGDDRIVEVESGRCRAAHGEGRGVQFMIGQQHQRAADQIGGVLVVRRPALARSADEAALPTSARSASSRSPAA